MLITVLSNVLPHMQQMAPYYYDNYRTTDPSAAFPMFAGMFGFIMVITLVSLFVGFAIQFLIAYLIYQDAVKSNIENPLLWAVITFFCWWLGLILYFFVAKRPAQPVVTPEKPQHHKSDAV